MASNLNLARILTTGILGTLLHIFMHVMNWDGYDAILSAFVFFLSIPFIIGLSVMLVKLIIGRFAMDPLVYFKKALLKTLGYGTASSVGLFCLLMIVIQLI